MIIDKRQYQITQVELDRFERQLAAIDREDPNLHPRLILGRVNSFKRTIAILNENLDFYFPTFAPSAPLRLKNLENHLGSLYRSTQTRTC
jgi:hypothetical protein